VKIIYPFVPKSNAGLVPGQFWSIPLSNGRFACGRVIQLLPESTKYPGSTKIFLAGLMDWIGNEPPTEQTIAGHKTTAQAAAHIVTILDNGGKIDGWRDLSLDEISTNYSLSQSMASPAQNVVQGFITLRPANQLDANLDTFSSWGRGFIKLLAEKL
jgi:hypothetical protein